MNLALIPVPAPAAMMASPRESVSRSRSRLPGVCRGFPPRSMDLACGSGIPEKIGLQERKSSPRLSHPFPMKSKARSFWVSPPPTPATRAPVPPDRSVSAPEFPGRHPFQFAKTAVEVREIVEAAIECDLGYGPIGLEQLTTGLADAELRAGIRQGLARVRLKKRQKDFGLIFATARLDRA